MNLSKALSLQLGRIGRIRERLLRVFPKQITLTELVPSPLRFRAYSAVEVYRIAEYGGERESLNYFLNTITSDDIVYDIGASVGLFSVAIAVKATRGQVYAFEPDPETRLRLQQNVHLNHLNNVHIIPWAVSSEAGTTKLYTNGAAGFAPSLKLKDNPHAPSHQIEIKTQSLDAAIKAQEIPLPDVLKIDIEGAEALCLAGCQQLLKGKFAKMPRVLFIEFHPDFLPLFGATVKDVEDLIPDTYALQWQYTRSEQEHRCYIHT